MPPLAAAAWLWLLCQAALAAEPAPPANASSAKPGGSSFHFDEVAEVIAESAEKNAEPPNSITLEVYYGAMCGHCLSFFYEALMPLIQAGLPGDRLKIKLLPWVPTTLSDTECLMNLPCTYAQAPICLLHQELPDAEQVDSKRLHSVMDFLYCDLYNTTSGATPPENREMVPICARQAGLEWDGSLSKCIEGGGGMDLLKSAWYRKQIDQVQGKLDAVAKQVAPFLFLNGEVLVCPGSQWCSALRTASGDRALEKPGTLLRVVCSQLSPAPEVCAEALGEAKQVAAPTKSEEETMVKKAAACENCVEVGSFRWHWRQPLGESLGKQVALAAACTLGLVALAAGAVVARRRRPGAPWLLMNLEEQRDPPAWQ